ncbi:MAG: aminopeptidase [Candidatus Diapherotrites archaeon]|nr:aminopeptidase [Candidatus Diapherotrites archaeon]
MNLKSAAENAVKLAKPKKSEQFLVVVDPTKIDIGWAVYNAASKYCNTVMLVMEPTGQHGMEPPKVVAKAMEHADIVYCITEYSLTHTNASRNARRNGATVVTMPGITKSIFVRGMGVDYKKVNRLTRRIGNKLAKAKSVHVVAKGTDIWLDVEGCKRADDDGDLYRGSIHNLPSGEAATAPKSANGYFTAKDQHLTKKIVRFDVRNGKVIDISNKQLKGHIWRIRNARNIAELGIGTNPGAKVSGNVLEDEKVLGTCHIAIGDSKSLGGNVEAPIHWDFIIKKPTIWFDKKKIMEKGRLLI